MKPTAEDLRALPAAAVQACVAACAESRYLHEPPFLGDTPGAYLGWRVAEDAQREDARAVALLDGGEVIGICVYRLPQWDLEHFGYPVGRLEHLIGRDAATLDRLVAWADGVAGRAGVVFASARLSAEDLASIHALERAGYRFQELILTPWIDLAAWQPRGESLCRWAVAADEEQLCWIARRSFRFDRFHNDPRFTPRQGDGVYEHWMRDALRGGRPTTRVVVLELNGSLAGFAHAEAELARPHGIPDIWRGRLTAMHPDFTGRGLGIRLYHGAFDLAKPEAAYVSASFPTRNAPVIRMHQKLGSRYSSGGELTLHRWYREP